MYKTSVFVLGLIGSIIGMISTFVGFFIGMAFWTGVFKSIIGTDQLADTSSEWGFGITISSIQTILTMGAFVAALVLCLPGMLRKDQKRSGAWMIGLGIFSVICNITLLVPGILVLVGGILGVQKQEITSLPQETERISRKATI